MSVTAVAAGSARAGALQAIRSEWVKLRTVRSSFWSLLLLAGVSILFTTITCWGSSTTGGSPGNPGDNDIVRDSLAGIFFGQIAAAVLAVLVVTSEYGQGMIRTTFAANPRRRTVLSAKTALVGGAVLAVGLATSAACFEIGQILLRRGGFTYANGYPAVTLADHDALRAVLASGCYLALVAVFSVGAGAILRHTAGAITLVIAVVLAPVIAVGFLPKGVGDQVARFSLMGGGLAMQQTVGRSDDIPIGPLGALAVVTTYALVAFAIALWAIGRRDA